LGGGIQILLISLFNFFKFSFMKKNILPYILLILTKFAFQLSVPQPLANSGFQQAPQAPGPQPAPVFGGGSSMLGPMRSNVPPFGSAYNSVAANLSSGLGLSHHDSAKILSSECPEDAISPPRPDAKHNESPHGKLQQPS
jgi:hypothetical protein